MKTTHTFKFYVDREVAAIQCDRCDAKAVDPSPYLMEQQRALQELEQQGVDLSRLDQHKGWSMFVDFSKPPEEQRRDFCAHCTSLVLNAIEAITEAPSK